ncbi:MAG: response regulator [Anaerolineae bacterium]|nr:response regulator [Anaerolineae bacterium]
MIGTRQRDIRVLIAEDDYLIAQEIKELAQSAAYTIVGEASDGRQAVEMVKQLADTPFKPDVILMDIRMPQIDGIEAAQQINDCCPTPVVVLTAYDTQDLVEKASMAGVGAYLIKPPTLSELERGVAIAMARFEDLIRLRRLNSELDARNQELEQALSQVKTLSGLLPICASCKKIRDDDGQWYDVAVYVRDHTQADFTHSLCPDCLNELYPPDQYPYLYDTES